MAGFDAALLVLVGIYSISNNKETTVYNNGYMQVFVSLSFNYKGDCDSECMDDLQDYAKGKAGVLSMDIHGNLHPLSSEWVRSTTDNGFYHDINHPVKKAPGTTVVSDIRVELFYTAPKLLTDEQSWVGELDGMHTNPDLPLVISMETFSVTKDNLEIADLYSVSQSTLRVMKYKDNAFSSAHKLLRLDDYQGLHLVDNGGNSWIAMLAFKAGVFPKDGVEEIFVSNDCYDNIEWVTRNMECRMTPLGDFYTDCHNYWESPSEFTNSQVKEAFDKGIPMVLIHGRNLYIWTVYKNSPTVCDFVITDFVLIDSFATRIKIEMQWNAGDSFGKWEVSSATVQY